MKTFEDKSHKKRSQSAASEVVQNKKQRGGVTLEDNRSKTIQKKANNTGLPDNLKNGVENLSGYALDDVKVHYNSSKPAQLNAHAYAQGSLIHLAPGQEKHLPHEAWHVVQQKQGRVQPTRQLKAKVQINDDVGLEKEADVMGKKANSLRQQQPKDKHLAKPSGVNKSNAIQRVHVPLGDPSIPGKGLPSEAMKGAIIDTNSAVITVVNTGSRATGHSQILVEHMTESHSVINTLVDLITPGHGNIVVRIKQVNSILPNLHSATSKSSWLRSSTDAVNLIKVAQSYQKHKEKFKYTFLGRNSRKPEVINCTSFAERILVAAKIEVSGGRKIAKPETLSNQGDQNSNFF